MSATRFRVPNARSNVWNNPRYGDLEAQIYDGDDHQSIYEIDVDDTIVRKIINGKANYKIKIGTFKIKYPKTKRLFDLELLITPNTHRKASPHSYCDFLLYLSTKRFQTNIARMITVNYIIYCRDLSIDTWRTASISKNKKLEPLYHESFQMKKFKDWYSESRKNERNTLKFCIMIKNIQLIDPKYHKNSKLITLSNFDYNQRYYKFTWNIDKQQIKQFKRYQIHEWYRSPISFDKWYLVLYPKSDTVIWCAKPGYVQMSLDLVTVPRSMYGVNVFYNAVIMETYSHFTNIKCCFESEKLSMSQPANTNMTMLKSEDLLKLNTITIEIEIYVFRPLYFDDNVNYKELFVTYWDRNSSLDEIKENPPNPQNMKKKFEWKICNDEFNTFHHFVNALNGQRFLSNLFEMGYLKWCLMIYPNGEYKDEEGFTKLSMFFPDTVPTKLALIVIRFQFYCTEFNVFQSGLMQFKHREDEHEQIMTPRWQIGALNINDVIDDQRKHITFGVNTEVIQVKNIQNDIIYSRKFAFELNTKIVMHLSIVNWAEDLFKYKDTIFNNMWCIGYLPKKHQRKRNKGGFTFMLYSLPFGISKLNITYTYTYFGIEMQHGTQIIDFDNSSAKFITFNGMKELLDEYLGINSVQRIAVSINIRIIELYDMNGNVMKVNSAHSNEIYRLSIYLWKYQGLYVEALYYLRKAFHCTQIFNEINDEENTIINRKLYLKKKRKLKHIIFRKYVNTFVFDFRSIAHCANCNRFTSNSNDEKFKLCKGCKSINYCSKSCQKRHWNVFHRLDCLSRISL